MQVSVKWINELVDIEKFNLDDLIDKLTLGGFEVEEVLELEIDKRKEIVLDISATANRSDSLSVQGISAEIGTLLNQPLKNLSYSKSIKAWKNQIENLSETFPEETSCMTFLAIIVENIIDTNAPKWLKEKLISASITPSNSF